MSVDSGLSGPVEGPVAPAAPRAGTSPRGAPSRTARPGAARADALADAISPPSFRAGRGRPRRRGRRATRIVRRIELWSVLKIALVFNTILLGMVLGSVALLWGLANTTGLVDDLEGFLRDAGFEDFRFDGEAMFEQVAFIGAVGALAATVFMVLATALLNLISEITGGIRFVVIEEIIETPAQPSRPPVPLALPTVPPAAPPVVPPAGLMRPPTPAPTGRANGPATSASDQDDDDPDSGPLSEAKAALAKTSTSQAPAKKAPAKKATAKEAAGGSRGSSGARSRGGSAKRAASRTSAAAKKAAGRGPTTTTSETASDGGASSTRSTGSDGEGGSSSGRRVRRQSPDPSSSSSDPGDTGGDDTSS